MLVSTMTKENKALYNKVKRPACRAQFASDILHGIMDELYWNGPEPVTEKQVKALAVQARKALRNAMAAVTLLEKIELGNAVPVRKSRRLVLIER